MPPLKLLIKTPTPGLFRSTADLADPDADNAPEPDDAPQAVNYTISQDRTNRRLNEKEGLYAIAPKLEQDTLTPLLPSLRSVRTLPRKELNSGVLSATVSKKQQDKGRLMSARIRDDTKEESTNSTHVPQLAVPPRSASSSISQGKDVLLSPTSAASNTMAPNIPLGEFQQSYIIQLLDRIHILEGENCALKQQDEEADEQCTSYRVFHMLENQNENAYTTSESDSEGESPDTSSYTAFLREPQWEWCDGTANLRGLGMIASPQDHIKADRKIAFAVYKYYNVSFQRTAIENAAKAKQVFPDPAPFRQSVQLISKEMAEAARNVARLAPNSLRGIVDLSVRNPTFEPFIWWYHQRHTDILHRLPDRQEALMRLLTSWVESNHSSIYAAIDAEFEQGLVSPLSIGYLVRPDEALVSIDPQGLTRGYIAMATANLQLNGQKEPDLPLSRGVEGAPRDDSQSHRIQTWTVKASSYKLDASLQVDVAYLSLTIRLGSAKNGPVPIRSLGVFPLRFASPETEELLQKRGVTFWKCRKKRLVSYNDGKGKGGLTSRRYMVDHAIYAELHQPAVLDKIKASNPPPFDLAAEEPPEAPHIYALPSSVKAFHLRSKKWVEIGVDFIENVTWNKDAFKSLVADSSTKELIQALVSSQLASEKGTDLIEDKGNGLIMLLHGSPGTGKTYTAESVAEIAEKPLYPVTCGDIGTTPEHVERYLQSIFHLGNEWGCVVLLDEAEVFLEQRNLSDLARNALVSVFLRSLEYYNGILILTTNRVGTFDEAFKSRIQLALHYEALNFSQRKEIWTNFFTRLKLLDPNNIDFEDINYKLEDLAEYEMNGRQIRNSITTARQLAQFRKVSMRFTHLEHAIKVAQKFDVYLRDVQAGKPDGKTAKNEDEEIARMSQWR